MYVPDSKSIVLGAETAPPTPAVVPPQPTFTGFHFAQPTPTVAQTNPAPFQLKPSQKTWEFDVAHPARNHRTNTPDNTVSLVVQPVKHTAPTKTVEEHVMELAKMILSETQKEDIEADLDKRCRIVNNLMEIPLPGSGAPLLAYAMLRGDEEILESFLRRGANIDAVLVSGPALIFIPLCFGTKNILLN